MYMRELLLLICRYGFTRAFVNRLDRSLLTLFRNFGK